jgi:hypothetical protein
VRVTAASPHTWLWPAAERHRTVQPGSRRACANELAGVVTVQCSAHTQLAGRHSHSHRPASQPTWGLVQTPAVSRAGWHPAGGVLVEEVMRAPDRPCASQPPHPTLGCGQRQRGTEQCSQAAGERVPMSLLVWSRCSAVRTHSLQAGTATATGQPANQPGVSCKRLRCREQGGILREAASMLCHAAAPAARGWPLLRSRASRTHTRWTHILAPQPAGAPERGDAALCRHACPGEHRDVARR